MDDPDENEEHHKRLRKAKDLLENKFVNEAVVALEKLIPLLWRLGLSIREVERREQWKISKRIKTGKYLEKT